MNTKIKELLIESGWPSEYINNHFDRNKRGDIESMKKFAELILQECIGVIESYEIPEGNTEAGFMAAEWTYDALKTIRDEINEKFGIEE